MLHELDPGVPDLHESWTDDDYAGRIVINLGRAGALHLDSAAGAATAGEGIQEALTEALLLGLEWARRRGWRLAEDFRLNLKWDQHTLLYLLLRTSEGITSAHWAAVHHNPSRAVEQINFAFSHLVDYGRYHGWPLEDAVARAVDSRRQQ